MTGFPGSEAHCVACGAGIDVGARFCAECGSPQRQEVGAELRKTVTLLFCDVEGSTALGEALDPEALRGVMGRYFEVARAAVERHGGMVEKFVGDAVLAVFGIPEVREDDALRAVRAAAELQRDLKDLCADLLAEMGVCLVVRTGVNTGSVVSGLARAGGSFATGDAVNTAARLEQGAGAGEVLLGATTYELVRDAVEVEQAPSLQAKGKAEPLAAYRLLRVLEGTAGRSRRPDAVLVGRERELRALADVVDMAAARGRSQLVTLLGPAGIGKTRLVEHFLDGLGSEVQVLRGRCVSYGRGITFWPVLQVLRQAVGLTGEEQPTEVATRLGAALEGCSDADAIVLRLLPLLGHGGEPGGTDETFWAVRALLEHLASTRPVVVALDDIHWAEPTLLDLLEHIRDEARDVPLVLICQARPELLEQRATWGGGVVNASTLSLEAISERDTASLLADMLGPGIPTDVARVVSQWADGNPLFVEEIAAHLVEEGQLAVGPEGWALLGDLGALAVPASVTALLGARLDRLDEPERRLLERMSVVGLEVTTEQAKALAGELEGVRDLLATLSRKDLLRRARGAAAETWAFRHVLLREAAYESLPKALRADLHVTLANRRADVEMEAGAEVDAFVGHHLAQAARLRAELSPHTAPDLAVRAAEALVRAAAHARDVEDFSAATALLRSAAEVAPTPAVLRDVLWRLNVALRDEGQLEQARATCLGALELVDADTSELERRSLELAVLVTSTDLAEEVAPAQLRTQAQAVAELARAAGDRPRFAQAQLAKMLVANMAAQWREVADTVTELLEDAPAQDRRTAELMRAATYFHGSASTTQALAFYRQHEGRPGQSPRGAALLAGQLAALLAADGNRDLAISVETEAWKVLAALDPQVRGIGGMCRVKTYAACGEAELALDAATAGVQALRAGGLMAHASTLLLAQAGLYLELGRDSEARELVDEAEPITSPYDVTSVGLLNTCRAVLAARKGDLTHAADLAAAAEATFRDSDELLEIADCHRALTEVAVLRGDLPEAHRLLTSAAELYRRKGHRPFLARTEQLLAELAVRS